MLSNGLFGDFFGCYSGSECVHKRITMLGDLVRRYVHAEP
jgi:hypothetical protein